MEPNRALPCNIALVGASSLKGKEVKSLLEERAFPLGRLALLDTDEARGQLTEFDGEPAIVQTVTRENFEDIKLAIFASLPSFTEKHWRTAEESGCRIVDLSYFLESHPGGRLRAPWVENLWGEPGDEPASQPSADRISVVAHPVAIAIAGLLALFSRRFPVIRSAITVFEPVSERGQAGVEELHRQTVSLLSFQELPRQVFDSQVAFNLLASYGEEARPSLREVQERIGNHLRRLLEGRALPPALRVLQAPVFHGYAFYCYLELAEAAPPGEIEAVLNRKPFCVSPDAQPSLAEVAGSDELTLGPVEKDPAYQAGYWIWGAMDNLRVAALNAVMVTEEIARAEMG